MCYLLEVKLESIPCLKMRICSTKGLGQLFLLYGWSISASTADLTSAGRSGCNWTNIECGVGCYDATRWGFIHKEIVWVIPIHWLDFVDVDVVSRRASANPDTDVAHKAFA